MHGWHRARRSRLYIRQAQTGHGKKLVKVGSYRSYRGVLGAADGSGEDPTARKLAVMGGGAVGIELASAIKSFYPSKGVRLVHPRGQLVPAHGPRVYGHVI